MVTEGLAKLYSTDIKDADMLKLQSVNFKKDRMDTLVIPVCENRQIHENKAVTALITGAEKIREFDGKKDDEIIFYSFPEINAERIVFIGLGNFNQLTTGTFREFAGRAAKKCIQLKLTGCHIAVPSAKKTGLKAKGVIEAMLEGACLGNHVFHRYKNEKKETPLEAITLITSSAAVKQFSYLPVQISAVCSGTCLAREWVSTPSQRQNTGKICQ